MPRRDWRMRIQDMVRAAEKIVSHSKDFSFDEFKSDEWTVDAILHNIAIIGEAARRIPQDVCNENPNIPWIDIRDMRNIIIHEYFGVDIYFVEYNS